MQAKFFIPSTSAPTFPQITPAANSCKTRTCPAKSSCASCGMRWKRGIGEITRSTRKRDTKRQRTHKQLEDVISRAVHLSSEDAKAKARQGHHKAGIIAKTATFEKYGAPAKINGEKCLIWFNAQTKKKGTTDVLLHEFGVSPMK